MLHKAIKESEAKGRTEGREEGIKEGLAEGLRNAIVTTIRVRFPDLTEQAQQIVAQINKPEKLNLLVGQIVIAPNEDAARLLLDLVAA